MNKDTFDSNIEDADKIKFFPCRCGCGCKQEHTNRIGSYCRDCEAGDCPHKCNRCGNYTTRDEEDGLCDMCAKRDGLGMHYIALLTGDYE